MLENEVNHRELLRIVHCGIIPLCSSRARSFFRFHKVNVRESNKARDYFADLLLKIEGLLNARRIKKRSSVVQRDCE